VRLLTKGMRRKVVVGAVGVLAAGGALTALGPAFAGGTTHSSSISARYVTKNHAFQGRVASDTTDCIIGRAVTLFKKTGPHHSQNTAIGSTHTNFVGFYRIPAPEVAGVYFTSVRKVHLPGYSGTVCDKAASSLQVIS
jgi:hypothetical protein